MATPFDWKSLIPVGVGAGLNILGNKIASGPQKELTAWEKALIESEMRRRNSLQGMVAPTALRALGYRDPSQISQMQQQISGNSGAPFGSTGGAGASVPQTPGSTGGKVLGAAGTGIGLASAIGPTLGFSALGGPIGMAIGGGLLGGKLIADQFGKGRRTANTFVDAVENPFGGKLAEISTMAGTDPKGAAARFQQEYSNYQNQTQGWIAQGGNQSKVAQQSLTNPKLQQTIQTLARQLGVQI